MSASKHYLQWYMYSSSPSPLVLFFDSFHVALATQARNHLFSLTIPEPSSINTVLALP